MWTCSELRPIRGLLKNANVSLRHPEKQRRKLSGLLRTEDKARLPKYENPMKSDCK